MKNFHSVLRRYEIPDDRYKNAWMRVEINNLVFVDESGVNLGMTRLYGRGKIGESVVSNSPRNKGKNTSVLGALSLDGWIASMTVIGSTNKDVFETYVEQILVPQLWRLSNCIDG